MYTNYHTKITCVNTFAKARNESVFSNGGEVIVPASGETSIDIARASVIKKPGIILGGDLNIITLLNTIEPEFLARIISYGTQHIELAKLAQGKSIVHLHGSDLSQMTILFPKKIEQTKVSSILDMIDSLINLYKIQLSLYESMRKGLLQQLFPSDSSNNPNVRFKGFTENWREYRFKDITSERNERSGVGELLSVTINNGIIKTSSSNRKNNSSVDMSNYKKVYKNDIAYNSMRMWQGASGISLYNGIVSPAYTVFHVNTKIINSDFIGYVLKLHNMTWKFRINSQGLTSDTWNLKYPLFSKINMKSPYLPEQSKISKLLKKLDGIIVLHHRQLEIYEMQRKYFLQKLFV